LTIDIITEYCFGKSYGLLAKPDLGAEWPAMFAGIGQLSHLLKQFGWLHPVMDAMPEWFVAWTSPIVMPLINFQNVPYFLYDLSSACVFLRSLLTAFFI
jgi:hypothetical protein